MSAPDWSGSVVLVNPPTVGRADQYIAPPIGLLSVAEALTVRAGAHVAVEDLALELREGALAPSGELLRDSARRLAARGADVYGFSVQSHNFPIAVGIARELKELRPGARVIFGGHHASLFGSRLCGELPWIDAVVAGSIEDAFPAGAGRDEFWRPRYESSPRVERYLEASKTPIGLVQVGRGCSYGCTFCSVPGIFGRATRHKPVPAVLEEIRYLVERGYRYIHFVDDALTVNRPYVEKLVRAIRESGLELAWTAMTRGDRVDPRLLQKLADAGCCSLLYGAESATREGLEAVGKGALQKIDFTKVLDWSVAAGIAPTFYFLAGIPGETEEGLLATLLEAARLSILDSGSGHVQLLRLTPNTPLWERRPADLEPRLDTPYAQIVADTLGGHADAVRGFVVENPELCSTFYVPNAPFDRSVLMAIDACADALLARLPATVACLIENGDAINLWTTLANARRGRALAGDDVVALSEAYVRDKVPRLVELVEFERWRRGEGAATPSGDGVAPLVSRVDWSGITTAVRSGRSIMDSLYSSAKRYCPLP